MCAVFGFLNYGKKVNHKVLVRLINELAKLAEIRGTDATGISYVNDSKMIIFKEEMLMKYCSMFGVDKSDIQLLLDFGYCADEIEEMLMDTSMLDEVLKEIKEVIE